MDNTDMYRRYHTIMKDLHEASLDDVTFLLDIYNRPPVNEQGEKQLTFNDPVIAARINARYMELTGQNNSHFVEQQQRVLDNILKQENHYLRIGAYTPSELDLFRRLKQNIDGKGPGIEIISSKSDHVLNRSSAIMQNPSKAGYEDVDGLLDYYNGEPVLVDGTIVHMFNDTGIGASLNARYSEFTGKNHSNYLEQTPAVLKRIISNRNALVKHGVYTEKDIKGMIALRRKILKRDRSQDDIPVFEPNEPIVPREREESVKEPIYNGIFSNASQHSTDELAQEVIGMLNSDHITMSEFQTAPEHLNQIEQYYQMVQQQVSQGMDPNAMIQQAQPTDFGGEI